MNTDSCGIGMNDFMDNGHAGESPACDTWEPRNPLPRHAVKGKVNVTDR